MIKIIDIDWSDKNNSTEVCDILTLSNGVVIWSWNGSASYCVYDKAKGRIEVGAELASVEQEESYSGEPYKVYTFK